MDEFPSEPPFIAEPTVDRQNPRCVIRGFYVFLLRISSFFGLAPLRFEARREGYEVSLSKGMCVYSYALVTILGIYTIWNLVVEILASIDESPLTQLVWIFDRLMVVVIGGIGVYGAPNRMRSMLQYMNSVAVVEHQLGGQYSVTAERNLSILIFVLLLSFLVLQVDDLSYYAWVGTQWKFVGKYAGSYLLWIVIIALQIQFAFTVLFLHARFKMFNEALDVTASQICKPAEAPMKSRLQTYAVSIDAVNNKRANHAIDTVRVRRKDNTAILIRTVDGPRLLVTPSEAVVRLSRVRCILYDTVCHINNGYELSMICILISLLLKLIMIPYFIIGEVNDYHLHQRVLQYAWLALHLIRLIGLVDPCHYTLNECQRTLDIVGQLLTSVPSGGLLQYQMELFSRQLLMQSISYSPLDILTWNRPLVVSILGAVTTYLVILVQFLKL